LVKRGIAAAEVLLVLPAVLFMAAIFIRQLQPRQSEPAHMAERILAWYAAYPPAGRGCC